MDDALAPILFSQIMAIQKVLILVVMDDALALGSKHTFDFHHEYSLNPCCNG